MAAKQVAATGWRYALARWAHQKSYFNQLGLMRDDIIYETPEVKEALQRLPKDVYDARMFRISRAIHLSNQKTVLPKEEWTKFEDDVQYLKPYLEQLQQEKKEMAEWNKQ